MLLKVIKTEAEYQKAARLEEIFHCSPEGDEAEVLTLLIEQYLCPRPNRSDKVSNGANANKTKRPGRSGWVQ